MTIDGTVMHVVEHYHKLCLVTFYGLQRFAGLLPVLIVRGRKERYFYLFTVLLPLQVCDWTYALQFL